MKEAEMVIRISTATLVAVVAVVVLVMRLF
jgi:hypothetical protein